VWSLRKMTGQSPVFPESIEDILTAVQETPRGRWFLEAYANRLKSDGTANILQAIAKLENNLNAMSVGGTEAGLLQQARNAIATAKREIALLEPQTAQLSAEGQLFAKLAELSRQAFSNSPAQSTVGSGVDRVLKLVTELDQNLAGGKTKVAPIAPAKPAIQYFKQDEEIFEPAPPPAIAAVAKPASTPEIPNKGAKLVIQRSSTPRQEAQMPEKVIEDVKVEDVQDVPVEITSTAEPEAAKPPEASRIVIIRRKAEEQIEVPLLDEQQQESVSAA
jgi:hypothetical protein